MKGEFMDAIARDDLYTPVEHALSELRRRRQDQALVSMVSEFLGGDIPEYLLRDDCFVLPRHIATPNNEALYVLGQANAHGALAVFSQDTSDRFTSVNNLKRRLARPEICEETPAGRVYRKIDILDVPAIEGQTLGEVRCRSGERLVEVHNRLFDRAASGRYLVADDAAWIDRNHRGDMVAHYRRFLALFVVHGILFEDFETADDPLFLQLYVRPLLAEMDQRWGYRPLIVRPYCRHSEPDERFDLSHDMNLLHRSTSPVDFINNWQFGIAASELAERPE
ncbi:MAG: hypothetical protein K0B16_17360 [Burkholderiaceae bacterium]|nr:hypothetical protein [Burkholderiaceae bacterium]